MNARRLIFISLFLSLFSQLSYAQKNTNWSLLGNTSDMQHHSDLDQINKDSVSNLELAWWSELPSKNGLVGNPLVQDGVVFQGGPGGQIFAHDAREGKLLWSFNPDYDLTKVSIAGYIGKQMNRGIALWGDKVIIATADCRILAFKQKSGEKVWEAQSCDAADMYTITAAPRVGDGLVFTGNACMDSGATRGYVDAFDAETGKHRWRFYTVPSDPAKPQDSPLYQKAEKTWGKDWYSKTHGCGSVWDGLTYDAKLNQLYIGVGGPAPIDPSTRSKDAGDELFTNSIVALDARTGEYKWHFKQVPHDGWNYDSSVGLMVADLPIEGQTRRAVLSVPKNGFSYVLDAVTGKFISGGAYTKMNWAKGLDAKGRPIPNKDAAYWLKPNKEAVVLPGGLGAHGWEALAFNPKSNTLFIPSMVMPMKIEKAPPGPFLGIAMDFLYGASGDPKWKSYGEVVAWDPVENKVKWRSKSEILPMNSGLLHTGGGLIFQGMADGRLVALDEASGIEVWSRQTGGSIRAAPSTVMVDGTQYIIIATGNGTASGSGSFVSKYNTTPQTQTPPRLLAFRIGQAVEYPKLAKVEPVPKPSSPKQKLNHAKLGKGLFEVYGCSSCHGVEGSSGGDVPNLIRRTPASVQALRLIAKDGLLAARGMPQFQDLTDEELSGLYAYIINEAWKAYEKDAAVLSKKMHQK
jgi:quinohemoprotein ethanol dehydrogenase